MLCCFNIIDKLSFLTVIHNDGPRKIQLNFARIVRTYVSKFTLTDPREAVQYYFLLRYVPGITYYFIVVSVMLINGKLFPIVYDILAQ